LSKVQDRVTKVLDNMRAMAEYDEYALAFCFELDVMLAGLLEDDVFGTEGQCDPRGDQRKDTFSMYHVEGVDK